jgi:GT2 family glycosyltransferase
VASHIHQPPVAVVLVTYYGTKYLDRLWASLEAQSYPRERWHMIVVENGPERLAAQWFRERVPGARVLIPGDNTGYAGGNALGMQEALAAGVDYVVVVTQDTHLTPDVLRALVDVAERHPTAGAVQPKLMRREHDGRAVIHSRGNELHYLGVGFVGGEVSPTARSPRIRSPTPAARACSTERAPCARSGSSIPRCSCITRIPTSGGGCGWPAGRACWRRRP